MPVAPTPRTRRTPLRILTAVPLCDGHDSVIVTINLELARAGTEVIYLGYHQSASAIARAAVQEDVHAIGLSSYNGGHLVFFREVLAQLRARGGADIPLFDGGGGTITPADARAMQRAGVDRIFFAGTPLDEIMREIKARYTRSLRAAKNLSGDRALARTITVAERYPRPPGGPPRRGRGYVIGVAGPGGAGKSTLIDELTARLLKKFPDRRVALLANDPSQPDTRGAILGDRVSAIYAQDDRVFFRSLATRGSGTGLAAAAPSAIEVLRASGEFDLIFVESVGIGQEGDPFGVFSRPRLVDAAVFVLPPHYGGRIQLQKISLLRGADLVVLNKCDDPRAQSAKVELAAHLAASDQRRPLHETVAARHLDSGTTALADVLARLAGLEPAGGEKPCQFRVDA